jgi:hypothetical protein
LRKAAASALLLLLVSKLGVVFVINALFETSGFGPGEDCAGIDCGAIVVNAATTKTVLAFTLSILAKPLTESEAQTEVVIEKWNCAGRRKSLEETSMRSGGKFTTVILAVWFCLALFLGIAGWFRAASAPVVGATVWTLTAVSLFACWLIPPIRRWASMVDPRWLIALHLTRFVGFYFLFLWQRGQLPEGFAVPGGVGDIAVALAAVALFILRRDAAAQRSYHKAVLFWNAFGLVDIVFVAFSALEFGLKDWQSMAPLRELPLSLLPTFLVPLIIASHVLIFVKLLRKNAGQ